MRKDTAFWNIFFMAVYLIELTGLMYFLDFKEIEVRSSIGFFEVIILSFATFRIARLVTKGKITDFIRKYFAKQKKGFLGTIHELIICSWCVGMWAALFLVNFFFFVPGAWIIILILAVSGMGSLIQTYTGK